MVLYFFFVMRIFTLFPYFILFLSSMVSGCEWHCKAKVIRRDFTLASRKDQRFF